MLRSIELEILGAVEIDDTISGLADKLGYNESYISEAVSELHEKGLVHKHREGPRKRITPSKSTVVTKYRDLVHQHPDTDFPELLTKKSFEIIFYLHPQRTVTQIADASGNYRNTVNRILNRLENQGIVEKDDVYYSLKQDFEILHEFVRELVHHLHRHRLLKVSQSEAITWREDREFLA